MSEESASCSRVTSSVASDPTPEATTPPETTAKEASKMTARVGQKAPDFNAPAYYKGGFTNIKLSDFLGKWVLVCFYPGDFTFV